MTHVYIRIYIYIHIFLNNMDAWPFIVVYCRVPIWISLVAHYTLVRLCFFFIIIIHLYLGCLVFFVARTGYVFKGVHISYRTLIAGKVSCVCVCVRKANERRQAYKRRWFNIRGSRHIYYGTKNAYTSYQCLRCVEYSLFSFRIFQPKTN